MSPPPFLLVLMVNPSPLSRRYCYLVWRRRTKKLSDDEKYNSSVAALDDAFILYPVGAVTVVATGELDEELSCR